MIAKYRFRDYFNKLRVRATWKGAVREQSLLPFNAAIPDISGTWNQLKIVVLIFMDWGEGEMMCHINFALFGDDNR